MGGRAQPFGVGSWARRVVIVGAGVLLLVPALVSGGPDADAQTVNYACMPGAGLSTQSLTIPAGVTSITMQASGAQGGSARNGLGALTNAGGFGGDVQATMPVTPGDVVYFQVGCVGEDAPAATETRGGNGGNGFGGTGGGTGGGTPDEGFGGGGGGGETRVMLNGTADANIVVIAGGGGGAGSGNNAGGGGGGGSGLGQRGADSTDGGGGGGDGGGHLPSCNGGTSGFNPGGGCVNFGVGGAGGGGAPTSRGGGGGGGGAQSGGGGGDGNGDLGTSAGGGGGGSSVVRSPATGVMIGSVGLHASARAGNGVLTISFNVSAATAVVGTPALTG